MAACAQCGARRVQQRGAGVRRYAHEARGGTMVRYVAAEAAKRERKRRAIFAGEVRLCEDACSRCRDYADTRASPRKRLLGHGLSVRHAGKSACAAPMHAF